MVQSKKEEKSVGKTAIELEKNKEEQLHFKTFVVHVAKYKTLLTRKFEKRKKYVPPDPNKITAFIPGTIKKIYIKKGKTVRKGQNLLILEAMKMSNVVKSPFGGKIKKLLVKEGDIVTKDQLMIELD